MIIHSTTLDTMEKVIAIYGGTTWEKIEGRFIIGASDNYAVDSEGGAASASITPSGTISNKSLTPSGSIGGTALTVAQIPSHSHSVKRKLKVADVSSPSRTVVTGWDDTDYHDIKSTSSTGSGATHTHSFTGTAASHNHTFTGAAQNVDTMPPYKAVYIWERTA